jgi:uncharacterized protein involved in exopolysaccharide biosynthesis
MLPVLFSDRWDAARGTWRADASEPTLNQALDLFDGSIRTVREETRSGLIILQVEWRDRELAARWANALVEVANRILREAALRDADESIHILQQEAAKTSSLEVRDAIYRIVESQIQSRTIATVREQFAFKIVDPALVPDPDAWIWPRRSLLLLFGMVLGLAVGVSVASWRELQSLRSEGRA